MSYIGREAQLQGAYDKVDDISGSFNGAITTFDIEVNSVAKTIGKPTNLIVGLDGALQEPDGDFNVSGHQIIFSSAPAGGVQCSITILGDVFKAPTTGNTDLNSLTDVVVGSMSDNEVLTYIGGSWVNLPQGTTHLSNNTDVDTSGAVNGDKFVFDGSEWSGEADTIDNINDVNASSPTDNQILTWNNTAGEWQPMDAQSTVSVINDLTDVDTTTSTPNIDQTLTWDGSNWVPADTQSTVDSINDLSDADTASVPPANGQSLVWNDGQGAWVPGTVTGGTGGAIIIDDLEDVDTSTTSPVNGQALIWNGANTTWVPGTVAGGAGGIDGLNDVDTTTFPPTNGQVLKWNDNNSQWLPQDDATGGDGGGGITSGDINIYATSTGNDTTGDGTSGYPYATIAKAIDHANNVACGGGMINILLEIGTTFYINSIIIIKHPNIIRLSGAGPGDYSINGSSNTGNPLFMVSSKLEILSCVFSNCNTNSIFEADIYADVLIYGCSGDINNIANVGFIEMPSNIFIGSSNFSPRSTSVFGSADVTMGNMDFDASNMNNESLLEFNRCNIKLLDFKVNNFTVEAKSIAKFRHCNINDLIFELQSVYTMHDLRKEGILYFGYCTINSALLDLGTYAIAPITFSATTANGIIYANHTEFDVFSGGESEARLIYAVNSSHVYIDEMRRNYTGENAKEFKGTMMVARQASFISVSWYDFEYGNPSLFWTTDPSPRTNGDTYTFADSNAYGCCIYITDYNSSGASEDSSISG